MMIDRSKFKAGDRVVWFDQPKRERFRRTGTIVGVAWSKRTGLEWLIEVDPTGDRKSVKASSAPFPLKTWETIAKGDRLRLETGETVTADDKLFYMARRGGGVSTFAILTDGRHLPVEPGDEVEWLNPT